MKNRETVVCIVLICLQVFFSWKILRQNHHDFGNDYFNFWNLNHYLHLTKEKFEYTENLEKKILTHAEKYSYFNDNPRGRRLLDFRKRIGMQLTGSPALYTFARIFYLGKFETSFFIFRFMTQLRQ